MKPRKEFDGFTPEITTGWSFLFSSLFWVQTKSLKISESAHVWVLNLPWLHRFHLFRPPHQSLAHPDWQIAKMANLWPWGFSWARNKCAAIQISIKYFLNVIIMLILMGYSLSGQSSQAHPHCQADQGYPVRWGNMAGKGSGVEVSPVCLKLHLHIQIFACRAHFSVWIQLTDFIFFMLPFHGCLHSANNVGNMTWQVQVIMFPDIRTENWN